MDHRTSTEGQAERHAVANVLKDPVCGMDVSPGVPRRRRHAGIEYVFCSDRCLARFDANPAAYARDGHHVQERAEAAEPALQPPPAAAREWTCPMHPEIVRSEPGTCPICGMALEPRAVTAVEVENPELADMRRRFWISAGFAVPLLASSSVFARRRRRASNITDALSSAC